MKLNRPIITNLSMTIGIILGTGVIVYHIGVIIYQHRIFSPPSVVGANHPTPSADAPAADFNAIVTAYCAKSCCCGRFADGFTASGKRAEGLICAADPKYPFGSKFDVNGVVYTVEDRGGAIKGNKIDLLFPTHQEALNWGVKNLKVRKELYK